MRAFLEDYQRISKVICLEQNYRQVVDGHANNPYLEFLARLRRGTVNDDDIAMVQSRIREQLPAEEQKDFDEVTWAYPTNAQVYRRNT